MLLETVINEVTNFIEIPFHSIKMIVELHPQTSIWWYLSELRSLSLSNKEISITKLGISIRRRDKLAFLNPLYPGIRWLISFLFLRWEGRICGRHAIIRQPDSNSIERMFYPENKYTTIFFDWFGDRVNKARSPLRRTDKLQQIIDDERCQ